MWSFLSILVIIAYVWILYYLLRLEQIGCKCALTWRRDYIMGFIIFILSMLIVQFFTNENPIVSLSLSFIVVIASIANVIIMLQYVHYLKEEKCKCSAEDGRAVMNILAIFQAIVMIIGFLVALSTVGHIVKVVKKSSKKLSHKKR